MQFTHRAIFKARYGLHVKSHPAVARVEVLQGGIAGTNVFSITTGAITVLVKTNAGPILLKRNARALTTKYTGGISGTCRIKYFETCLGSCATNTDIILRPQYCRETSYKKKEIIAFHIKRV